MLKLRVLTTVSAVALATAAGVSGAQANNLFIDLNLVAPTITIAAGSSDKVINDVKSNISSSEVANVKDVIIAYPNNTLASHDVKGGTDNILVDDKNGVFAVATGNETVNFIDFVLAENGGVSGDDGAATLGAVQLNANNDIIASVDNSDIQADVLDLGAGSSVRVDTNTITSSGLGNTAKNTIAGDVNQLQESSEVGQASLITGSPILTAGATALVGNVQGNLATGPIDMTSTVSDSRIGLLARVSGGLGDPTAIVGVPLDVTSNTISADFTGNEAVNTVALGADKAVTLVGTAGVANAQVNSGRYSIDSEVRNVAIEAGNTQNYPQDEYIADLDGSTLTFQDNEILAETTSNSARNTVSLDKGLSQTGNAVLGTQKNTVDFGGADAAEVSGDLFIANAQYSDVGINAKAGIAGGTNDARFNVLVEDSIGSTIIADDNTVGATATGSAVVNSIDVGNATQFDSLVAINTVQYTEGTQNASNNSHLNVNVASTKGVGDVTKTGITVEGNESYAEAIGNSQSSEIAIDGTTVTGVGGQGGNVIESDRDNTKGFVEADYSILNAQVLDGGGAISSVLTAIDVDVADLLFQDASVSVSDNDIHALTIGNLSTEATIAINATTIDASIGVANVQTVEDGASLSASIAPNTGAPAFVDLDVGAGNGGDPVLVTKAAINADSNTFDARVWGNLADATTNSILVSGVTVGDTNTIYPEAIVDHSNPVTFSSSNAGYSLLNDQSVEDLGTNTVLASATGDLVNVTVGSADAVVTNSDITASKNSATTSATLNQGTSKIGIDAITLDASSGLVNVQNVTAENGLGSAQMKVDQNDLDITIDVIVGNDVLADLSDLTVQANSNSTLASARINQASSTINVKAQTETVDGVWSSGVLSPNNQTSIALEANSFTRSEHFILNDQGFDQLSAGGVVVNVTDNDITVDLSVADDAIVNTVAETDLNTITALVAGNDASNTLALDVGTFDLTGTDGGGNVPGNGPIASIASNQVGSAGEGILLQTNVTDTTIAVDANADANAPTTFIDGSNFSADSNTVRALSRSNNVSNALSAKGTTIESLAVENPAVVVNQTGAISTYQTQFAVVSRQINSAGVESNVEGTAISVEAGSIFGGSLSDGITGTSITANGNLVVSEARGNDAANAAALNFTDNGAQGFVANLQFNDAPVTYEANTNGTEISVLTSVDGTVTKSAFSASGNAVAALASANRATNVLNSGGTNVTLNNNTTAVTFDSDDDSTFLNGGPLVVQSGLAVVNVQGNPGDGNPGQGGPDINSPAKVNANVFGTLIAVISDGLFDSGSVKADDNIILAQGTQHNANNTLNITASANIDSAGDGTAGASVASLQQLFDGSSTTAGVGFALITASVDDPRSDSSFAASASDNQIIASAIGGTANNTLRATAGASLNGNSLNDSFIGEEGEPTTLSSGYNVLNVQIGDGYDSKAAVFGALITAGGAEDYSFDAVTVSDNLVQAEARGFVTNNILDLKAGSSSDATAALANLQVTDSGDIEAGVIGVAILTGNFDEGAEDSSLTVGGNTVEANASANKAVNFMRTTAAASLQESSGAGSIIDPNDTQPIQVSDSDYALLNAQYTNDSTVTAGVAFVGIGIDGLEETTGVNRSALSVEGNEVLASAVGNDAVNTLVLNTGTFSHPTASISSLQSNNGTTVTATVEGVAIGIGGITTINANSTDSSFSVRGNSIGATAIGNSGSNTIRAGLPGDNARAGLSTPD